MLFVPLKRAIKGFLQGRKMVPTTLATLILLALTVAGLWDVYCVGTGRDYDTVSRIILAWAHEVPAFAFSLGLLIGHLLWPQYVSRPPGLP